ncbi:MAG: glycogen/starch synthase [Bacteroidetes bacterium]|nr:glycogen/starch synthase [Bacteroidota bacterium]MCY4205068.1 glycogen/starch synthase [Bacteroidota bacterium]
MDQLTNVLFVTGEIDPFANESDIGTLIRYLPEGLHEDGTYETRIMMPRYGTISERKNRLHQVIRLCGTKVPMGNQTETLAVKVTAIPGTRCQVYFMDSKRFFKRKGLHRDREGIVFDDNPARALFFARSTLETVRKLQWKPDIVHAFGWISGFLPLLLATEYKDFPVFDSVKTVIFTPDLIQANAIVSNDLVKKMKLSLNGDISGMRMSDLGSKYSDIVAYPPSFTPESDHSIHFSNDPVEMIEQATNLYEMASSPNLA